MILYCYRSVSTDQHIGAENQLAEEKGLINIGGCNICLCHHITAVGISLIVLMLHINVCNFSIHTMVQYYWMCRIIERAYRYITV